MLLSEAWKKYQSDKKVEDYSSQYKLLKRFFDDIKMSEFAIENLKQYLIEKGGHLKPSVWDIVYISFWEARLLKLSVARTSKIASVHDSELKHHLGELHNHDLERELSMCKRLF